ncbi:MAG: AraC family transcriptional regulator [Thermodesulfobacteriota bacterium]|nr:AraC family transcriptional regulator [Thermodesulfobacteriota bacterium]
MRNKSKIERALIFIEKNLERPITLGEVSREGGMSKFYFSRFFKIATGNTFKKYIITKRLDKAKKLLKDADMDITEICFQLGFNDLSYFSRIFRKKEGITPSAYRKKFDNLSLNITEKQESPDF